MLKSKRSKRWFVFIVIIWLIAGSVVAYLYWSKGDTGEPGEAIEIVVQDRVIADLENRLRVASYKAMTCTTVMSGDNGDMLAEYILRASMCEGRLSRMVDVISRARMSQCENCDTDWCSWVDTFSKMMCDECISCHIVGSGAAKGAEL